MSSAQCPLWHISGLLQLSPFGRSGVQIPIWQCAVRTHSTSWEQRPDGQARGFEPCSRSPLQKTSVASPQSFATTVALHAESSLTCLAVHWLFSQAGMPREPWHEAGESQAAGVLNSGA